MIESRDKAKQLVEEDTRNRCPDYDDECVLVKDHLQCFLGLPVMCGNGIIYENGTAKGYCPFIHPTN